MEAGGSLCYHPRLPARERPGAEGAVAQRDPLGARCQPRERATPATGRLLRPEPHGPAPLVGHRQAEEAAERRRLVELVARHAQLVLRHDGGQRDAGAAQRDDRPAAGHGEDAQRQLQLPRRGHRTPGRRDEEGGEAGPQADVPLVQGPAVALHLCARRPSAACQGEGCQRLPHEPAEEGNEEPDALREGPVGCHPEQQDLRQEPEGVDCI